MQLSDVLEDTNAIQEAIDETNFQKRLAIKSRLPKWKKIELLEQIKKSEFGLEDIFRIFGE